MNARRVWRLPALVVVLSLLVVAIGCKEVLRALTPPDVSIQVTDTSCPTATVRWGDGSSNDMESVVELPWSRDLGTASGLLLIVVARRECDDEGTIRAEVHLDGELEDHGTATGPQAVASASASFL